MTRIRKRIGEDGVELMLSLTVDAGLKNNTIQRSSCHGEKYC
ncbi:MULTISPECIES: hypothetical protein [unclassified Pseudoalteromonas]|nr:MULTISPECIES: hypothetical protein [unclassified Pseudoalteromonas]